jgi:hypothetical protein
VSLTFVLIDTYSQFSGHPASPVAALPGWRG